MANPYSENPYEPPVRAELIEQPKAPSRKRKELPVVAIGLALAMLFAASIIVYPNFPLIGTLLGGGFVLGCIATLVGMVVYDLWWWARSD